jgi:hypothetical protein
MDGGALQELGCNNNHIHIIGWVGLIYCRVVAGVLSASGARHRGLNTYRRCNGKEVIARQTQMNRLRLLTTKKFPRLKIPMSTERFLACAMSICFLVGASKSCMNMFEVSKIKEDSALTTK